MKRIYAIVVLLLMTVGAYAQSGKTIYNKYSDSNGVSAVYISPTMFRMIGQLPNLDIEASDGEKVDIAPLVRSFEGFYLLSVSDKAQAAELKQEVQSIIKSGRFEMLMEAKDSGNTMRIYTAGNDKNISSLVMLAQEGDSVQFICLEGSMNRNDFESMMTKSIK
ncbi:MAG: DUF4252 domain-containing protein [Bacteroidales bacterium]|nr:DUF4252 domain-containing protein [Bacteroidales bacterium]